jgi:hypothetical protein
MRFNVRVQQVKMILLFLVLRECNLMKGVYLFVVQTFSMTSSTSAFIFEDSPWDLK